MKKLVLFRLHFSVAGVGSREITRARPRRQIVPAEVHLDIDVADRLHGSQRRQVTSAEMTRPIAADEEDLTVEPVGERGHQMKKAVEIDASIDHHADDFTGSLHDRTAQHAFQEIGVLNDQTSAGTFRLNPTLELRESRRNESRSGLKAVARE